MTFAPRFTAFLASLLFLTLVACTHSEKRQSPGAYLDDAVVTTNVKAALVGDPELKATEIHVTTYNGTVQLSGFVAQPDHIQKAENLVRGMKGVKAVKNDIAVKR